MCVCVCVCIGPYRYWYLCQDRNDWGEQRPGLCNDELRAVVLNLASDRTRDQPLTVEFSADTTGLVRAFNERNTCPYVTVDAFNLHEQAGIDHLLQ